MKKTILFLISALVIAIAACGGGGDGGGSDVVVQPAVNATGTWKGLYNSSVYGVQTVTMNLQQNGTMLSGTYYSTTGSLGQISGSMSGNTATVTIANTVPGCIGSSDATGIIDTAPTPDTMSFSYSGSQTCGSHAAVQETGTGNLTKQ